MVRFGKHSFDEGFDHVGRLGISALSHGKGDAQTDHADHFLDKASKDSPEEKEK